MAAAVLGRVPDAANRGERRGAGLQGDPGGARDVADRVIPAGKQQDVEQLPLVEVPGQRAPLVLASGTGARPVDDDLTFPQGERQARLSSYDLQECIA